MKLHPKDFKKSSIRQFNMSFYTRRTQLRSKLGPFDIVLTTNGKNAPRPDREMFDLASSLVSLFKRDFDKIHRLIFADYRGFEKENPEWLEDSEVPLGLKQEDIGRYLLSRTLKVTRDPDDPDELFRSRVILTPKWDEEHGFHLMYARKRWIQTDC